MARFRGLPGAFPRYLHLLRTQYWHPEKLRKYVDRRLRDSLAAAVRIPFYRDRFGSADSRTLEFGSLPILPRHQVSQLAESVRSLYPPATQLLSSRTSGSTAMPITCYFDARHQAGRFAARARYLIQNGWSPFRRSAWIMNIAMSSPDAEFSRDSRFLGARFFPHTSDLERQADWLQELDPLYLYAYPVNLDGLARIFEARGRRLNSLRKIFSASEVLEDSMRARLRRVFGVDVSDNYGSTEAFLAGQCPQGSYHVNAEHVLLEIVDEEGRPSAQGALGRVLVTTLENHLMPLIRYEIGDYAIAAEGACPCGRTLPRIERIVGRVINLFVDRDGKRFVPWDLFNRLKAREWVTQYQVVQRDVDRFTVRYAATHVFAPEDEADVRRHFQEIIGSPITVDFERLDQIPRAPSGKFMAALCELAAAEQ
ncbi:MAG TPA: AMP-binding protein [Methylomirabilota bacterium]|nr:AMP-binding protein [Methylomirabilota bacterium]